MTHTRPDVSVSVLQTERYGYRGELEYEIKVYRYDDMPRTPAWYEVRLSIPRLGRNETREFKEQKELDGYLDEAFKQFMETDIRWMN